MRLAMKPDATLPPWAAYVCTDQGADLAQAAFDRMGLGSGSLRGGGLSGAARVSGNGAVARRVLAEMGNLPVELACEGVAEIRGSGAEVIVLGHARDLDTYRALRRAGALDYFAFPASPEDILSLRDTTPEEATAATSEGPRVIGVTGASGGVGASLLAQNLAHVLARRGGRVALIDGDLRFGVQALSLDTLETPGFSEALSAPGRVDATFFAATMTEIAPGLSLYAQQVGPSQSVTALEAALPRLIAPLRESFDSVVIDLPRGLVMADAALASCLDALCLVVPGGYAGVNAGARVLSCMASTAPDLRVLPVLSELRRDAGLSARDMQTGLGRDIAATLPRADAAMTRAHRAGRALAEMAPRGPYTRAVAGLAAALQGDAAPRPGLFKSLLG